MSINEVIRGRHGVVDRGRRIREAAGLSLRELAHELRVNEGTLSRWENGECRPRPEAAARYYRVLTQIEATLENDRDAG